MAKEIYSVADVAAHNKDKDAWVIIDGGVYDMSDFLDEHPGGKKILLNSCGKDSSEKFWKFHSKKVLEKTAKPFLIGAVEAGSKL
ncbi:cytochrome b5 [Meredithblackwellia eburnea MCA 4105]